ncbi:MAG: hypothetical protein MUC77_19550 [Chromatiaceae bacterium]|nr:hypothetical protein [Chromatiaceae bacterium]
MNAKQHILAAAILVVLSASDSSVANEAHSMIDSMSNEDRSRTFATLLKTSGENCGSVIKTYFQGFDTDRNAFWNVACNNSKSYVIMISNDSAGSTRILSCAALKAANSGECFNKF